MFVTAHFAHWALGLMEVAPILTIVIVLAVWHSRGRRPAANEQ